MQNRSAEALSQLIIFSKYARYREDLGRRETWDEIVDRVEGMHLRKFPGEADKIRWAFDFVRAKKVVPSMRSLQYGGEAIERDNERIFNCWFAPISDVDVFAELFHVLMCGGGCGFSVETFNVDRLPYIRPKTGEVTFTIPDTKEGWASAVGMLMHGYLTTGARVSFDYSQIRPKGTPLKVAGGKAPGPEPLRSALTWVDGYLSQFPAGYKLRPIDCHSILCRLSEAVSSGGHRRSALISLFSLEDEEMLTAKAGNWWKDNPHFARANNSVVLYRDRIGRDFFEALWERIKDFGSGEPGIMFSSKKGMGGNPCQPGFATVLTPEGIRTFDDIDVGSKIWSEDGWVTVTKKWSTGVKPVYAYQLAYGRFIGTENHRVVENGVKIEVKDARVIDYLPAPDEFASHEDMKREGSGEIFLREYLGDYEVFDITVDGEHHTYWTGGVNVSNCLEVSLNPFQACNLVEINAATVESQDDLEERARAAAYIGTLQAAYTDFSYLSDRWREITEKEALIGVSLTGIAAGRLEDLDLLPAALLVNEENHDTANRLGINPAARTTVIKPSGTSSLALGTSSGIHAYHSPYYIRRVRYKKNEAIAQYLMAKLPALIEDDAFDPEQIVVSLPQKAPDGAITRDSESMSEFLERVARFNREWIAWGHHSGANRNNVSATVSVPEDAWDELRDWCWENRHDFTGISFLPYSDHSYVQAPFEACDEETYYDLMRYVEDIDLTEVIEWDDATNLSGELACSGPNGCEVRYG